MYPLLKQVNGSGVIPGRETFFLHCRTKLSFKVLCLGLKALTLGLKARDFSTKSQFCDVGIRLVSESSRRFKRRPKGIERFGNDSKEGFIIDRGAVAI